jgi:glycosyltransferase involved in cell wall biosynthesis
MTARVIAVIPALDEAANIADVVRGISPYVRTVVVVDNGSVDATGRIAADAGALVVAEPQRGYGRACLAGVSRAHELGADVVLFLDADGSDDPEDAPALVEAVVSGRADLALGVRSRERIEPGAMTPVQRFGNWLAPLLMRWMLRAPYHDMPPLKAIDARALASLDLRDTGHGYTIEMLLLAHAAGLRTLELPVRCRVRRGGVSKVSGTVRGASRAAVKIVSTIARHAVRARVSAHRREKKPWARAASRSES